MSGFPQSPHLYGGYTTRKGWGRCWVSGHLDHRIPSSLLFFFLLVAVDSLYPPIPEPKNHPPHLLSHFTHSLHYQVQSTQLLISLRIHAVHRFSWFYPSQATVVPFSGRCNSLLNWSPASTPLTQSPVFLKTQFSSYYSLAYSTLIGH